MTTTGRPALVGVFHRRKPPMNPYAEAILRLIETHAQHKKKSGNRIRFNGWWREGSSMSCSLHLETGTWRDFATNTGGGATAFARMLGMSMKQLMGDLDARDYKPPPPAPRAEEPHGIHESWEALMAANKNAPARTWLATKRGFGALVDDIASGFAYVDRSTMGCWQTERLASFVEYRIREAGPHIAFPIRDAYAPGVLNMGLRPLGDGERRFIPGAFALDPDTQVPRLYGFASHILKARRLVVVEGAVDTLAMEVCTRDMVDVGVVGVTSVSMVPGLTAALTTRTEGEIIFVPQLDPPRYGPVERGRQVIPGEQSQRAVAKAKRTLEYADQRCRVFDWDRAIARLGAKGDGVNDVGDILKLVGAAAATDIVVEGLEAAWA